MNRTLTMGVALLIVATACSAVSRPVGTSVTVPITTTLPPAPTTTMRPVGGVTVVDPRDGSDVPVQVEQRPGAAADLPGALPLSPAVSIQVDEDALPPDAHIEVDIGRDDQRDQYFSPFVAMFDDEAARWIPLPSSYDSAAGVVSATIDHVSTWQAWQWDWMELVAELSRGMSFDDAGVATQAVTCTLDAMSDEASLSLAFDAPSGVFACLGVGTDSTAVLQITNGLEYPIAAHPTTQVQKAGGGDAGVWAPPALVYAQRAIGDGAVIAPGGTRLFTIPLDPSREEVSLQLSLPSLLLGTEVFLRGLDAIGGIQSVSSVRAGIECLPGVETSPVGSFVALIDLVLSCVSYAAEVAGRSSPALTQAIQWTRANFGGSFPDFDMVGENGFGSIEVTYGRGGGSSRPPRTTTTTTTTTSLPPTTTTRPPPPPPPTTSSTTTTTYAPPTTTEPTQPP